MNRFASFTIRLTQSSEQTNGCNIKRLIGLMPAKFIIPVINGLNLEANPRNSRLGAVTEAIVNSIAQDDDPNVEDKLFPFKSKGILIAASRYTPLERGRILLEFFDKKSEGILDGGHNTLAIGSYILNQARKASGGREVKRKEIQYWEAFKQTWVNSESDIEQYLDMLRDSEQKDA